MNSDQLTAIIIGGVLLAAFIMLISQKTPEEVPKMAAEETTTTMEKRVRESVIAGSWYPGDKEVLREMLDGFLSRAKREELGIRALISPHAGYAYSGRAAGFSYKQLESEKFKKVIILAPSHQYPLQRASIADYTHYRTPLGEVKISSIAKEMIDKSKLISSIEAAHSEEHSLEIQLPFLQRVLPDFELIPIVLGRMSRDEIEELAEFLSGYVDEDTLLVASTDLSHFHPYDQANAMDKECIDSIISLDFEKATKCEMCGHYPVLVTMHLAKSKNWKTRLLKYENSGDVTGDRSSVVGYAAIAFYSEKAMPDGGEAEENSELLNEEEQKYLLKLARDTLEGYVRNRKTLEPETENPKLKDKKGAFVTLEKRGQLRGCIGHIRPVQELYLDVRDNAINAAMHDPRFPKVRPEELEYIEIEVSVLTTPELIEADSPEEYLEKIQSGTDGIILEQGMSGATYLPQVWEKIPDREEFLHSLCNKAGLSGDCWKKSGARIYRYRVQAFKESGFQ